MTPHHFKIVICRGPDCGDLRNSAPLHGAFADALRQRGLQTRVELGWQSCFGRCRQGPNVLVRIVHPGESRFLLAVAPTTVGKGGALYNGVQPADALRIVDEHLVAGRLVRELIKKPEEA